MLIVCTVILLFSLPLLANVIALLPINGVNGVANGLRDTQLLDHMLPIALYVLGNSVSSLLTSVCASYMRMSAVLVIGSLTQVVLLGLGFIVLQLAGHRWFPVDAIYCLAI